MYLRGYVQKTHVGLSKVQRPKNNNHLILPLSLGISQLSVESRVNTTCHSTMVLSARAQQNW
jgi:hypothetical protein